RSSALRRSASAVRTAWSGPCAPTAVSGVRSTCTWPKPGPPGHVARYRAGHSESGLDVREGTVRLRLPAASRPAHQAADSEGVGKGGRSLGVARADGPGTPRRAVADDRG